jgi:2-polyprenyl-6-methoxyphenol hydroxylase-like FAD-dependent oxidoreductase
MQLCRLGTKYKTEHLVRVVPVKRVHGTPCGRSTTSTVWCVDHVVVVGAGIGGLAASLVLSRVAARVTLVERAERPSEVGAALALQPNGMAVLDRLGLLPAVEVVSARIDRMDIRSVTGRRLLTAGMPDLGAGLDHAIAVRRIDLHRLLLEAVAGEASIDTRFGWTVVSADPSGAVRITAAALNGRDSGSMSLRADLIVGADGVNSAVRSTGGFVSRVSLGSSYVRTIVGGRASPWFEEYWTPLGSFGQAPLGGDLIYFWAAAHVAGAADAVARRDLGAFRQEWRRVLPAAADLLERVSSFDDLLVNTVRSVACRRWFSGRLVLLGDAAHAMPPNLGQGANSALVDGVVLAQELARAPSVMDALVGYDKRRRPLARRVQKTAEMLQRLCGIEQVTALRVRDALLAGLARFPRLSDEAIRRALATDIRAIRSASLLGNSR